MDIKAWDESYCVKIKEMDDHHKKIFKAIQKIVENIQQDKPNEDVPEIIDQLLSYSVYHFTAEEKLMKENDYPGIEEQMVQHKNFTDEILRYKNDIENGKLQISLEIATFLNEWLIDHILTIDKKYSDFFSEKGIS